MNQFILVGKVVEKPVLQENEIGVKYLRFVIDSKRDYKNSNGTYDSDRYEIVLWKELAENISEVINKGSLIGVKGRLTACNIVDGEGEMHYNVQLTGERVSILEKN